MDTNYLSDFQKLSQAESQLSWHAERNIGKFDALLPIISVKVIPSKSFCC